MVKQSGSTAELRLLVLILLSNFSSDFRMAGARWKGGDTSGLVLALFLQVLQAKISNPSAKGSHHLVLECNNQQSQQHVSLGASRASLANSL